MWPANKYLERTTAIVIYRR